MTVYRQMTAQEEGGWETRLLCAHTSAPACTCVLRTCFPPPPLHHQQGFMTLPHWKHVHGDGIQRTKSGVFTMYIEGWWGLKQTGPELAPLDHFLPSRSQSQEPRTYSWSPSPGAITTACHGVQLTRKLEAEAKEGLEPSHSCKACRCPLAC